MPKMFDRRGITKLRRLRRHEQAEFPLDWKG